VARRHSIVPLPEPLVHNGVLAPRTHHFDGWHLAGLLADGMPPRLVRELLATFTTPGQWRSAPVLGWEDPRWRATDPLNVPHDGPLGPLQTLVWGQDGYPHLFNSLPTPPPVIFVAGDASLLGPAVVVVAGGELSKLGAITATVAVDTAVEVDATVAADLSAGVGALVHARLAEHGRAGVAVAASSLDTLASDQRDLAAAVVAAGGCIISELPARSPATERSKLARLRLYAACADPLVLAEAPARCEAMDAVAEAVIAGRPVVVARPRTGHRRHRNAAGPMALSRPGVDALSALAWNEQAARKVIHYDPLANAVCDTRDELADAVRLLWWFRRDAHTLA
jgi:hypothetical protein